MKQAYVVAAFLALSAFAGATFRRPEHKPPAIPELSKAQKTELQKLQKVVGEVGTVPVRTGHHADIEAAKTDLSAAKNVAGVALPSRAGSQAGADILKQAQSDLEGRKMQWLSKLPMLGYLFALLFLLGYIGIRILDKQIPYRPRRRRRRVAASRSRA